ncbi:MAG TPA: hypothetical protein VGE51_07940 [Fontimonas sp.]
MDAHWLLTDSFWLRFVAALAMLAPAILILFSRRASRIKRLLWAAATQLPWGFIAVFVWIWQQRYDELQEALPLGEAMGWWMLAFPWAVYLLYRATRAHFSGEARQP